MILRWLFGKMKQQEVAKTTSVSGLYICIKLAPEIDIEVWKRCHQLHLTTSREPPRMLPPVNSEDARFLLSGRSRAKLFLRPRRRIAMRWTRSPAHSKLSVMRRSLAGPLSESLSIANLSWAAASAWRHTTLLYPEPQPPDGRDASHYGCTLSPGQHPQRGLCEDLGKAKDHRL